MIYGCRPDGILAGQGVGIGGSELGPTAPCRQDRLPEFSQPKCSCPHPSRPSVTGGRDLPRTVGDPRLHGPRTEGGVDARRDRRMSWPVRDCFGCRLMRRCSVLCGIPGSSVEFRPCRRCSRPRFDGFCLSTAATILAMGSSRSCALDRVRVLAGRDPCWYPDAGVRRGQELRPQLLGGRGAFARCYRLRRARGIYINYVM